MGAYYCEACDATVPGAPPFDTYEEPDRPLLCPGCQDTQDLCALIDEVNSIEFKLLLGNHPAWQKLLWLREKHRLEKKR